MKIMIVRHARTTRNEKDISQSQKGGILSESGKKQAKLLAERLKNEKIDIIFSSDALRTRQTLREIRKFQKAPVAYDKFLRERRMGNFIGKPMELYRKERNESGLPKWEFKPRGGESYSDMSKRAEKFIARLKKRKEGCVLIVSHGGIIRMILGAMMKMPVKKAFEMPQDNACVNIIEMKENPRKGHFVFVPKSINSRSHLGKFR